MCSLASFRTTAERSKALDDHINAWLKLDWAETHVPPPLDLGFVSELIQGVYIKFDNIFQHLYVYELPSRVRGTLLRKWKPDLTKLPFRVNHVSIDPASDMLILIEL